MPTAANVLAMVRQKPKKHEDPSPAAWTVRYADPAEADLIRRVAKIKSLKPGTCIRSLSIEAARRFADERGLGQ